MKNFFSTVFLLFCAITTVMAQNDIYTNNDDGTYNNTLRNKKSSDSTMLKKHDQEIPQGIHVWTVDEHFGDRTPAVVDTLSYMYMNTMFNSGLRGEYNTLGNMGSPRINRIIIDRPEESQFLFTEPYDFIIHPVSDFHFTNTYSPITNVTLNSFGNRTNGSDDFKAIFATNAGKRLGFGFRFDYKYGRGTYAEQSTSHFGYTFWLSYLGDQYQAHLLFSTLHQKVTENGGITNDNYITHPESFSENFASDEIPTVLSKNWNRNDNQHIFFTHRYNVGFNRKIRMTDEEIKARKFAIASKKESNNNKEKEETDKKIKTDERTQQESSTMGRPDDAKIIGDESILKQKSKEDTSRVSVFGKQQADSLIAQQNKIKEDTSWLKNEYVPVTSFIHTLKFDHYRRIYEAYETPDNYYATQYYNIGTLTGDSIYDRTDFYEIQNTFAIGTLEGFSKWAKAGLKAFIHHDFRHIELPDATGGTDTYNENTVNIGGQISKQQGTILHYNVTGEYAVAGKDAGQMLLDSHGDLNFKFFGDTVHLAANAFFHRINPGFYYRHYHSRHFWWDNDDMNKMIHSRIEGIFSYDKTRTQLRIAMDEYKDYYYFSQSYNITSSYLRTNVSVTPMQNSGATNLMTLQLSQNFTYGILNWDNVLTYQHSSNQSVMPVPSLNIYSNLYMRFKIARVLHCDMGADVRYFTKYYAPDYSPALSTFTVQGNDENRVKTGNYPIVNVYANFLLKHTRFFVMMSHVNSGSGNLNYFLTPHYPLNESVFRFGVSWNFFN